MRKQLLITSLALIFTTHFAAAQSSTTTEPAAKSEPAANSEPAAKSDTAEPLKTDDANQAPAKPARKAARRRETTEHKARRIAKKYGVTW
jgi:hypothetical protein